MRCHYSCSQGYRSDDRCYAFAKYFAQLSKKKIVIALFFLLLTGCRPPKAPIRFEGIAMTMAYCIQIGDPLTSKQEKEIEKLITSTFAEINEVFNNYNPNSQLSKLNELPSHQKTSLSFELYQLLVRVDELVKLTEGRFDPTVAPLQQLWKQKLKKGTLPTHEEIEVLIPAIGWNHVHLEGGFFWKDHPLTAIDLGGIAKGYAVDLLLERLQERGYHQLFVEWGGEIRTLGKHPEKRAWKIAIKGLCTLDLDEEAIATSGSYHQNWTVEGVNYTHITDPRTLLPLQETTLSSVSVITSNCTEADAWATALMVINSKEVAKIWAEEKGLKVLIW